MTAVVDHFERIPAIDTPDRDVMRGDAVDGECERHLHRMVEQEDVTDVEFGSFFVQLVTAANDTTRTMLSSGLLALLEHPHQLAAVRADPGLIPGAVEEILQWANPLHYFRRTATGDDRLGGVEVSAGDKLAMMYTSANRDETVFDDPHRFDIGRDPNPHLSFGVAEHTNMSALPLSFSSDSRT